ncbi:MAG: hypothetical protein MUF45_03260 [Spirosomaceae bacterium]|jgi:hypothetical protein|nr:hypothetical protein [Spirosomataceae bacterium]
MLQLKSGHLLFESELVNQLFGNDEQVNTVYYPERKDLLIAPRSKTFFQKLHKTSWTALKLKNPKGDKTIFIRDLLLDHDIDDTDRQLEFEVKSTGIIEIKL